MKNAGAVLLPSQELLKLSRKVDLCLSGRRSPTGCDIRYRQNFWVMVFDDRGELVGACDLGKMLTREKKRGIKIPRAFVDFVESAVKKNKSLESLERAFLADKGAEQTVDALQKKLKEMDRVGQMRVADFLTRHAADSRYPAGTMAKALSIQADACDHQVIDSRAFNVLRQAIEDYLSKNLTSPAAQELIAPLLDVALKYHFDLESYSNKLQAGIRKSLVGKPSADAQKARAWMKSFRNHRDTLLAGTLTALSQTRKGDWSRPRLLALLGRAEDLIEELEKKKSIGVMKPIHSAWRNRAAEKLRARGKSQPARKKAENGEEQDSGQE